jgi:hypothetical protein
MKYSKSKSEKWSEEMKNWTTTTATKVGQHKNGHSRGCQIFLLTTYQSSEKYRKTAINIPNSHINIPKGRKIDQMAINYTSTIQPCKIYPNWYFWFENIPSGNP